MMFVGVSCVHLWRQLNGAKIQLELLHMWITFIVSITCALIGIIVNVVLHTMQISCPCHAYNQIVIGHCLAMMLSLMKTFKSLFLWVMVLKNQELHDSLGKIFWRQLIFYYHVIVIRIIILVMTLSFRPHLIQTKLASRVKLLLLMWVLKMTKMIVVQFVMRSWRNAILIQIPVIISMKNVEIAMLHFNWKKGRVRELKWNFHPVVNIQM